MHTSPSQPEALAIPHSARRAERKSKWTGRLPPSSNKPAFRPRFFNPSASLPADYDFLREMMIDNFAGGGGTSTGMSIFLGRSPDAAINHDLGAIAMHRANHPDCRHYCESVWDVVPSEVTEGRPVGLVWLSPDCKHFSKAKGKAPVNKNIRGLAWVGLRWIAHVRPRILMLENVEEFQTWGPLKINEAGEAYPDKEQEGRTFRSFVNAIRRHGYNVEWRELRASDYGINTIRKRFFLIARCDGQPIVWPDPTHGERKSLSVRAGLLPAWKPSYEIIDWSIPCQSIFGRKRPLVEKSLTRLAKGIKRFVIDDPEPFIIHGTAPFITEHANGSSQRVMSVKEPLRTICAQVKGGHFAVVQPVLRPIDDHQQAAWLCEYYGKSEGSALTEPARTATGKPHHALAMASLRPMDDSEDLTAAWLSKHYGGVVGASLLQPTPTITAVDHNGLSMVKLRAVKDGESDVHPEMRAFVMKYFGTNYGLSLNDPLHTATTKARFALVITIHGRNFEIIDILHRMLQPHELFAAQSFPRGYIIDRDYKGNAITKGEQYARCGNSVCPQMVVALMQANLPEHAKELQRSRRAA